MSEEGIEWLKDILQDVQLIQFLVRIRDDLQITRLEHFDFVKAEDLENIGLSKPGTWFLFVQQTNLQQFNLRCEKAVGSCEEEKGPTEKEELDQQINTCQQNWD